MLWRDEQRGLGELMIDRDAEPPRCLGFAQFHEAYDHRFAYWFQAFVDDLLDPAAPQSQRLQLVQRTACDLVRALDATDSRYLEGSVRKAERPLDEGAAEEALHERLKTRSDR
jgi:hypothetical protein